jgi:hypothetical protein
VRDVAQAATSQANQVSKEVAQLTDYATIGFVDAYQGGTNFGHG